MFHGACPERSRRAQHDSASFAGRVLKHLEFIFQDADTLTSVLSLRERRTTKSPGQGNSNGYRLGRDFDLESKSRQLLRELGAAKLAREVRVEWNPRLKTAAGRADFREKLISLNPLLRDHGEGSAENQFVARKLDCLKQSSLTSAGHVISQQTEQDTVDHDEIDRTLRHELAHLLAQWRVGRHRIAPHGPEWRQACCDLGIADEARCHNLPFATKVYPPRYVYRCPNCRQEFPRVRRIRRAVACLACCRAHNRGEFDQRFRLRLLSKT
jgi:predicted SprT family Zn-dependent metalloprotease